MLAGLRLLSALVLAVALSSQADALFVRRDAAPITLPFARRVNATGAAKLLKIDQARAKALKSRAKAGTPNSRLTAISNVPASNQAVDYTTTVRSRGSLISFVLLTDCCMYFRSLLVANNVWIPRVVRVSASADHRRSRAPH